MSDGSALGSVWFEDMFPNELSMPAKRETVRGAIPPSAESGTHASEAFAEHVVGAIAGSTQLPKRAKPR